ncbi:MAG: M20 family metallopeptidase [Nitrososphaerales archaeon]
MIEINSKSLVEELQNLIRIPSRNPPGEEKNLALYLEKRLKDLGLDKELIAEPYENRPQVVARLKGSLGKPKLIINGHMDTVPEGDVNRWSFKPFEGVIKDDKVYGRGASDIKGGIASTLIALDYLLEKDIKLKGDLILQFVIGEETGEPGTKDLLLNKKLVGDYGIVLEPTSLKVANAIKGLAWFHIKFIGKPCHASCPEYGINAIFKALSFCNKIESYSLKLKERKHKLLNNPKVSVTMIRGGVKENMIPESCLVSLDRRIIPNESLESVKREIEEILEGMKREDKDLVYECWIKGNYEPAEIPEDAEIASVMRKNVELVTKERQLPFGLPAATDMRNFVNDAKIPAVTFGPGNLREAHSIDEYVEVKQLVNASKVLILTIKDLLS